MTVLGQGQHGVGAQELAPLFPPLPSLLESDESRELAAGQAGLSFHQLLPLPSAFPWTWLPQQGCSFESHHSRD